MLSLSLHLPIGDCYQVTPGRMISPPKHWLPFLGSVTRGQCGMSAYAPDPRECPAWPQTPPMCHTEAYSPCKRSRISHPMTTSAPAWWTHHPTLPTRFLWQRSCVCLSCMRQSTNAMGVENPSRCDSSSVAMIQTCGFPPFTWMTTISL